MFDWGFWEFLVVGVVGLLVFGPERLPEVARNIGRWVGKARRYIANVRADFESEMNTSELRDLLGKQQEQIRELKNIVDDAQREVGQSVGDMNQEIGLAADALNKTVKSASDQAAGGETPASTPAPMPLSALSDEELFGDEDEDGAAVLEGPIDERTVSDRRNDDRRQQARRDDEEPPASPGANGSSTEQP